MAYLIDNHSAIINKIGSYESLKGLATFKAFPYVYYLLCITICQVLSPAILLYNILCHLEQSERSLTRLDKDSSGYSPLNDEQSICQAQPDLLQIFLMLITNL